MRQFGILCSLPAGIDPDSYLEWDEVKRDHPDVAESYILFCRRLRAGAEPSWIDLCIDPDSETLGDDDEWEDLQFFWRRESDGAWFRYFWSDAHYAYWHVDFGDGWKAEDDQTEEEWDSWDEGDGDGEDWGLI